MWPRPSFSIAPCCLRMLCTCWASRPSTPYWVTSLTPHRALTASHTYVGLPPGRARAACSSMCSIVECAGISDGFNGCYIVFMSRVAVVLGAGTRASTALAMGDAPRARPAAELFDHDPVQRHPGCSTSRRAEGNSAVAPEQWTSVGRGLRPTRSIAHPALVPPSVRLVGCLADGLAFGFSWQGGCGLRRALPLLGSFLKAAWLALSRVLTFTNFCDRFRGATDFALPSMGSTCAPSPPPRLSIALLGCADGQVQESMPPCAQRRSASACSEHRLLGIRLLGVAVARTIAAPWAPSPDNRGGRTRVVRVGAWAPSRARRPSHAWRACGLLGSVAPAHRSPAGRLLRRSGCRAATPCWSDRHIASVDALADSDDALFSILTGPRVGALAPTPSPRGTDPPAAAEPRSAQSGRRRRGASRLRVPRLTLAVLSAPRRASQGGAIAAVTSSVDLQPASGLHGAVGAPSDCERLGHEQNGTWAHSMPVECNAVRGR